MRPIQDGDIVQIHIRHRESWWAGISSARFVIHSMPCDTGDMLYVQQVDMQNKPCGNILALNVQSATFEGIELVGISES